MKREIIVGTLASVVLFVTVLMFGCTDPNGAAPGGNITGTVKNSRGQPVANAYLNMFYSSVLEPFKKTGKTLPSTSIEIQVPHPGFLRAEVQNYIHGFVCTLIEESVAAGYHTLVWDSRDALGRDVYSDCFWVVVTLDGAPLETKKLLIVKYQYDDPNPAPFAMTDGLGRFSIPFSRLPLTETFIQTDYSDLSQYETTIGPTDEIYAFTPTLYGSTKVTYSSPHELTIILGGKPE